MVRRGRTAARSGRASERPAGGDLAARRARLREVVEPVVAASGCDLEELSVSRAGRRHLVRVMVDSDVGVSLDTIAELSRTLSAALDAAEESAGEFVAGEYVLEVSSPGVDRPLTQPRHWRRNVGRLVKVGTAGGALEGRVVAADDARVVLDVAGVRRELPYAGLGPGRVQVEFSRLEEVADDDPDEIEDEEVEDDER